MGMIEKVVLLEKCQNRLFIFPFDSAIFLTRQTPDDATSFISKRADDNFNVT